MPPLVFAFVESRSLSLRQDELNRFSCFRTALSVLELGGRLAAPTSEQHGPTPKCCSRPRALRLAPLFAL